MSQGLAACLSRITHAIERCITLLDEIPVLSADQVFLKTFLHNATGYLQKDIAPDTEALENWDSPENQRMLRRYIRHLTTEIRMVAEELHKGARQDAARQRLAQRMTALLTSVEAEQGVMELLLRAPHRLERNGEY